MAAMTNHEIVADEGKKKINASFRYLPDQDGHLKAIYFIPAL